MAGDDEYVAKKVPGRMYVSKQFEQGGRQGRLVSRVFEAGQRDEFVTVKEELVIRTTPSGRQQLKAFFYADDRNLETLTLQRFGPSKPMQGSFSLRGDEIDKLLEMAAAAKYGRMGSSGRFRIDEGALETFAVTKDAARALAKADPAMIAELARTEVLPRDIVALAYRKQELRTFQRLLEEKDFFEAEKARLGGRGTETVWQAFFEKNQWIFGYGLSYVFATGLDPSRLEQMVAGSSVSGAGKRVDALLRTRGLVSALCFVEIKTHQTDLLERKNYRPEAWPASRELAGAISQIQRTVHSAERAIREKVELRDEGGNPTGDRAYLFKPRAVLVAGTLGEFRTEYGINEEKYGSFELLRRSIDGVEIVTFDELYERARFIVDVNDRDRRPPDGGVQR